MQKRGAMRYFENAKELLSKSQIEDNTYTDVKYVQEACGTAYLAVLNGSEWGQPLTWDRLHSNILSQE